MGLPERLDPEAKRRQWHYQRALWGVMAVLLALAGVGLLGTGPLSERSTHGVEGDVEATLDYHVWNRRERPSLMSLEIQVPPGAGDTLAVTLSYEVVGGLNVDSTMPPESGAVLTAQGVTYRFDVANASDPVAVRFHYTPERIGWWDGTVDVRAGDREPVRLPFEQRIFP